MHLVDVATRMQLASTGQVAASWAACVPFLYRNKQKMTIYKGEDAPAGCERADFTKKEKRMRVSHKERPPAPVPWPLIPSTYMLVL